MRRGVLPRLCLQVALLLLLPGAPAAAEPESPSAPAEPRIRAGREIVDAARDAIDAAHSSLSVVLYKFDEPSMLDAVKRALDRGVRVRLLADASEAARQRSLVGLAERAGAEVRLWPARLGKLHVKLMLLDERRAISGSFNWTRSAASTNVELLLDFREPDTVKRLGQAFEALWDRAAPPAGRPGASR